MPLLQSPVKKAANLRNRYTVRERISAMKWCAKKKLLGWSQRKCALHLKLTPKSLRNWQKQYKEMMDYKKGVGSMHAGPKGQLEPITDELLQFIFARREQGVAVSRHTVVLKASKLLPGFSVKTGTAKYAAVRRFLRLHNLVYRIGTHVSQKAPELAHDDAIDFVKIIRPFLHGPSRDPRWILNMDQTPVFYSMHEKYTLNRKGARTVNVRCSKNESERITVAVTISAAGDVLAPTIVFKGKSRVFILLLFIYIYCYYYNLLLKQKHPFMLSRRKARRTHRKRAAPSASWATLHCPEEGLDGRNSHA